MLVTANWWDVDRPRHDRAIYDVLWTTEPHWLHGRTVKLIRAGAA